MSAQRTPIVYETIAYDLSIKPAVMQRFMALHQTRTGYLACSVSLRSFLSSCSLVNLFH